MLFFSPSGDILPLAHNINNKGSLLQLNCRGSWLDKQKSKFHEGHTQMLFWPHKAYNSSLNDPEYVKKTFNKALNSSLSCFHFILKPAFQ